MSLEQWPRELTGVSESKHAIAPMLHSHVGKKPLESLDSLGPIRLEQSDHDYAEMHGVESRKGVKEIAICRECRGAPFNRCLRDELTARAT